MGKQSSKKKRILEYSVVPEGEGMLRVMEAREENTKARWEGQRQEGQSTNGNNDTVDENLFSKIGIRVSTLISTNK